MPITNPFRRRQRDRNSTRQLSFQPQRSTREPTTRPQAKPGLPPVKTFGFVFLIDGVLTTGESTTIDIDADGSDLGTSVSTRSGRLLPQAAQVLQRLMQLSIPFIIKTNSTYPYEDGEDKQGTHLLYQLGQLNPPVTGLDWYIQDTRAPFLSLAQHYNTVLVISTDPLADKYCAVLAGFAHVVTGLDLDVEDPNDSLQIDCILVFSWSGDQANPDLVAHVYDQNRDVKLAYCSADYDRVTKYKPTTRRLNPKAFTNVLLERLRDRGIPGCPHLVVAGCPDRGSHHGFWDVCQAHRQFDWEESIAEVHRSIDDWELQMEKDKYPGRYETRAPARLETVYFITNHARGDFQELMGTRQSVSGARIEVMVVHDPSTGREFLGPREGDRHHSERMFRDFAGAVSAALTEQQFPVPLDRD